MLVNPSMVNKNSVFLNQIRERHDLTLKLKDQIYNKDLEEKEMVRQSLDSLLHISHIRKPEKRDPTILPHIVPFLDPQT
jgi:hypothetical protein